MRTHTYHTSNNSVQKALRMVDPSGIEGFQPRKVRNMEQLKKELGKPTDLRMFAIAQVHKALPYTYCRP
jgi:hypothetical protein